MRRFLTARSQFRVSIRRACARAPAPPPARRARPAPGLCKAALRGVGPPLGSVSLRAGGRPRRGSACPGGRGGAPLIMVSGRGEAGGEGAGRAREAPLRKTGVRGDFREEVACK